MNSYSSWHAVGMSVLVPKIHMPRSVVIMTQQKCVDMINSSLNNLQLHNSAKEYQIATQITDKNCTKILCTNYTFLATHALHMYFLLMNLLFAVDVNSKDDEN